LDGIGPRAFWGNQHKYGVRAFIRAKKKGLDPRAGEGRAMEASLSDELTSWKEENPENPVNA